MGSHNHDLFRPGGSPDFDFQVPALRTAGSIPLRLRWVASFPHGGVDELRRLFQFLSVQRDISFTDLSGERLDVTAQFRL